MEKPLSQVSKSPGVHTAMFVGTVPSPGFRHPRPAGLVVPTRQVQDVRCPMASAGLVEGGGLPNGPQSECSVMRSRGVDQWEQNKNPCCS